MTVAGNASAVVGDPYDFGRIVTRELVTTLLGDELGSGVARRVYECRLNPDLAVKVETRRAGDPGGLQNAMEWMTWEEAQDFGEWSSWLAPCRFISDCGCVLLQERTTPARPGEVPDRVPNFLSDLKVDAWGLLGGRPVVHDYGLGLSIRRGLRVARMCQRVP